MTNKTCFLYRPSHGLVGSMEQARSVRAEDKQEARGVWWEMRAECIWVLFSPLSLISNSNIPQKVIAIDWGRGSDKI